MSGLYLGLDTPSKVEPLDHVNMSLSLLSFQGGREVNDFIAYLKKEATNPLVAQEEPKKKKTTEL